MRLFHEEVRSTHGKVNFLLGISGEGRLSELGFAGNRRLATTDG